MSEGIVSSHFWVNKAACNQVLRGQLVQEHYFMFDFLYLKVHFDRVNILL